MDVHLVEVDFLDSEGKEQDSKRAKLEYEVLELGDNPNRCAQLGWCGKGDCTKGDCTKGDCTERRSHT